MVTTRATSKSQKNTKSKILKKDSLNESISNVVIQKKVSNNPDANVSVFTKTTNPNIIINSEDVAVWRKQNFHKHRIIKSVCLLVMCVIILMTFFLSLKTYNTVNEIYQLFNF